MDEQKKEYVLYIEPLIDPEDGKWYASSTISKAITFLSSGNKEDNLHGECMINELYKLKIEQLKNKLEKNLENNCLLKRD